MNTQLKYCVILESGVIKLKIQKDLTQTFLFIDLKNKDVVGFDRDLFDNKQSDLTKIDILEIDNGDDE